MAEAYVYMIQNLLNDKIYVGVSVNPKRRWKMHKLTAKNLKNARYLHYAMSKHINEIDNIFEFFISQFYSSEEEAYQAEIYWISYLKENGFSLYNVTSGGEFGTGISGVNNPFYGKNHTKETKNKISYANKGKRTGEKNYFFGKKFIGQQHPLYGTKRPQNVLDALSKTHKGKVISKELRDLWSKQRIGMLAGEKHPMYGIKGEDNPNSGISDDLAKKIYRMYHYDHKNQILISKELNVNKSTVFRVVNAKERFTWLNSFNNEEKFDSTLP